MNREETAMRKTVKRQNGVQKKTCIGIILLISALLIVQLGMMMHFGKEKSGFHVDEMFTYELTTLKDAAFLSSIDGFLESWQPGEVFHEALSVSSDEAFDYSIPYNNQKDDVHPPLYYFVILTAASFVPEVFSKWIGIISPILFSV